MSGSDSESSADSAASVPGSGTQVASQAGKPKRWAWSATDAYFTNIMIRTCCEIIESGKTMNMPSIHAEVMEIWHRR
jgi:hypothetical protein